MSDIWPLWLGPVRIVDVGAMNVGAEPYDRLLRLGRARVVGFEPNAAECAKLNDSADGRHIFLPYAIGDGTRKSFYLTNTGYTSSLLPPNTALLKLFQGLAEVTEVVEVIRVQTLRLDDIAELRGTDYLKMDVQGAEKEVLDNAGEFLRDVLVVHVEVEFLPMYEGQPLFADIDGVLRRHGFVFHKFVSLHGRPFLAAPGGDQAPVSQMLWGDAVYIRDFRHFAELPMEKLLKLTMILFEVYRSVDLCRYIIEQLTVLSTIPGSASPRV